MTQPTQNAGTPANALHKAIEEFSMTNPARHYRRMLFHITLALFDASIEGRIGEQDAQTFLAFLINFESVLDAMEGHQRFA